MYRKKNRDIARNKSCDTPIFFNYYRKCSWDDKKIYSCLVRCGLMCYTALDAKKKWPFLRQNRG